MRCLEVKKQKAKKDWIRLRINCSKQCKRDLFRGRNAPIKVQLIYLELLKHQVSYG